MCTHCRSGSVWRGNLLFKSDERLLAWLQPDLLITFGDSVLSKNGRSFSPEIQTGLHWHIQAGWWGVADVFERLRVLPTIRTLYFFQTLFEDLDYQRFLSGMIPNPIQPILPFGSGKMKPANAFRAPKCAFGRFEPSGNSECLAGKQFTRSQQHDRTLR